MHRTLRIYLLSAVILITALTAAAHAEEQVSSGIVRTKDNITISYEHHKNGFDSVVVISPGFFNSKDNRWMQKTVQMLASDFDVIIFDMRGHGKSGGLYTWTAKEYMDMEAVLDYAKTQGYKHIGALGFSLGAAVAVNCASKGNDIDSLVLVSCPSRFRLIDYYFWEPGMWADLKDNIDCKWEGKGARFSNFFLAKQDAIDAIGSIKNIPILFIQGDDDWVIRNHHVKRLYDAANVPKKIEIIKGGLHAERLIQFHYEEMRALIVGWFKDTLK